MDTLTEDSIAMWNLADGMSEAIALGSPSGRMSKRARMAAEKRLLEGLFRNRDGTWIDLKGGPTPQPTPAEKLRQHAARLLELADRGMSQRKFRRLAAEALAEAAKLEGMEVGS